MKLLYGRYRVYLLFTLIFFIGLNNNFVFSSDFSGKSTKQKQLSGTYAGLTRLENGRADIQKLLTELKDLGANTYNWLIWQGENDWDDLQAFLPLAKKNKINVWVTVVPPSESKPRLKWNSEPYATDYVKWAQEIALLSKKFSNLVAFSIDDFAHNLSFYTVQYVKAMTDAAHQINPKLLFIPCVYFKQITPAFVSEYGSVIDAILFPYRAESEGANLQNPALVEYEVGLIRNLFNKKIPVYLDVYSSPHSRLGASTPDYVKETIENGKMCADGVLIYQHPSPVKDFEKYSIVKKSFKKN